MTPLTPLLLAQIDREGPMTLADYMAMCLHHPEHGYYSTRNPLGERGDFITAPEISQMFGELLGLALAQAWLDQCAPRQAVLAELGPGRGTLMTDLLRATRSVPGFHDSMQVCLVEASPALREVQRKTLEGYRIRFCDTVGDLPDAPLFLIANEFFDALPIRAFQRTENAWAEWRVGTQHGKLMIGLHPMSAFAALADRLGDTRPGDVVELCPAGEAIASEIGRRISDHGGAALIVDYGALESREATFQAVRRHEKVDPLAYPGDSDLTAHVAFGPLMRAAQPACSYGPMDQGAYLMQLGIGARADALAARLSGPVLAEHRAAQRRLTAPEEMGTLFKVIGFAPDGAPPPPGLDP